MTDFILLLTTSCTFSIRYISCSIINVQAQCWIVTWYRLYLITHHELYVQLFGTLVVPSQTSWHKEDESPGTDFILSQAVCLAFGTLVVPSQASKHSAWSSPDTDFILLLTTSCTFSFRHISCSITDILTQGRWITRDRLYLITSCVLSIRYISCSITGIQAQCWILSYLSYYLGTGDTHPVWNQMESHNKRLWLKLAPCIIQVHILQIVRLNTYYVLTFWKTMLLHVKKWYRTKGLEMSRRSESTKSSHPVSPPTPGIVGGKPWEWMGSVLTVGGTVSTDPRAWVIHGSHMRSLWLGMALPPRKGINTRALRAWGLDSVSLVAPDQPPQANQMTSWLGLLGCPALGSSQLPWWSLRKGCLSSYFGCLVVLRLI